MKRYNSILKVKAQAENIDNVKDLLNASDSIGDEYTTYDIVDKHNRDFAIVYQNGELLVGKNGESHTQMINKYIEEQNEMIEMQDEYEQAIQKAYDEFKTQYISSGLEEIWKLQFGQLTPKEWLEKYPAVAEAFFSDYDMRNKLLSKDFQRVDKQEMKDKLNSLEIGLAHLYNNMLFIDTKISDCNINEFIEKAKEKLNIEKVYAYVPHKLPEPIEVERLAKRAKI